MKAQIAYIFDAVILLLPTEFGGRRAPVFTGYRPNFNFNAEQYFCGEVRFREEVEWIAPGQSVEATVVMIAARHIPRDLGPGYVFKITEGTRIVGTGIIRNILKRDGAGEDELSMESYEEEMKRAMQDSRFQADIAEVMEDFKYVDREYFGEEDGQGITENQ